MQTIRLADLIAAIDGTVVPMGGVSQSRSPGATPDSAAGHPTASGVAARESPDRAGGRAAKEGRAPCWQGEMLALRRVVTDSRQVQPGDVFWAFRGQRVDGHTFVGDAVRRGARVCVVEAGRATEWEGQAADAVLIQVDDTLRALQRLAGWYRGRLTARVIAVTGSVGKTTTREMIHAVLSAARNVVRSPRNYNNHIGVPLSLLAIDSEHDLAVLELAASRSGEIAALAELVQPRVGVVTGVAPAHLKGFGTIEAVADEKASLLKQLPSDGLAVLPAADRWLAERSDWAGCPVQWIVEEQAERRSPADIVATDVSWLPPETGSAGGTLEPLNPTGTHRCGTLRFRVDGRLYEVAAGGRHLLRAALTALAVARWAGLSEEDVVEGFRRFRPVTGRCVPLAVGPWTVIDDTYNASPASCRAACRTLADWPANRRWLVIGDMLEMGDQTAAWHERLGRDAAAAGVDYLLVCGEQAGHVAAGACRGGLSPDRVVVRPGWGQLVSVLSERLEPGDVVLVKGSRAMRMERVIRGLREQANRVSLEKKQSRKPSAPIRTNDFNEGDKVPLLATDLRGS